METSVNDIWINKGLCGELFLDPEMKADSFSLYRELGLESEGCSDDEDLGDDDIVAEVDGDKRIVYSRVLAVWRDPTSLPNTRNKCVKWCSAGPFKTCCGWKTQYKWIYVSATLQVITSAPRDIEKHVKECLVTAAVIAAIEALSTGGAAAIAVAEAAFKGCLLSKLGSSLVSVRIRPKSRRGRWE